MRTIVVLCLLLAAPAVAQESLASRFPAGASAYIEVSNLHGTVEAVLQSPLGRSIKEHPAVQKFLLSPEGARVVFGEQILQGATGLDFMGLLKSVAGKQLAIGLYGMPPKVVAMTYTDRNTTDSLLAAVELMTGTARTEVKAATDQAPALYQFKQAHFFHDGKAFVISNDSLLIAAVHGGVTAGLDRNEKYLAARRLAGTGTTVFAMGDLSLYGKKLRQYDKPKNIGEAFILGVFAHYVPKAPWAALSLDLQQRGDAWTLQVEGYVPAPAPEEAPEAVRSSYGGTLPPLPLALPDSTLGVIRVRRSLNAMWGNQEALIAEAGLAGLVKFETDFGNLTSGMSWVEELLPALGDEMIIVATRPTFPGERTPAIHFPQGAVLLPLEAGDKLKLKLQVAWQNFISILNLQSAQMRGNALFSSNIEYGGVMIQTARYAPPEEAELEGQKALPPRYNFQPSSAMVGRHFVVASHIDILKQIIDGYGKPTPAPDGVNAGLWVMPEPTRALLAENREALIARVMLEQGDNRTVAEKKVDTALDLGRYIRSLQVTARESRAAVGLRFELGLAVPADSAPAPAKPAKKARKGGLAMHEALRPFQPTRENPWDHDAATHLWRRAGFAAAPAVIEATLRGSPADAAVAVVEGPGDNPAVEELEQILESTLGTNNADSARAWLIARMVRSDHGLREKIALFWHSHFATSIAKVRDLRWMMRQYRLFLDLGLGARPGDDPLAGQRDQPQGPPQRELRPRGPRAVHARRGQLQRARHPAGRARVHRMAHLARPLPPLEAAARHRREDGARTDRPFRRRRHPAHRARAARVQPLPCAQAAPVLRAPRARRRRRRRVRRRAPPRRLRHRRRAARVVRLATLLRAACTPRAHQVAAGLRRRRDPRVRAAGECARSRARAARDGPGPARAAQREGLARPSGLDQHRHVAHAGQRRAAPRGTGRRRRPRPPRARPPGPSPARARA